MYKIKGDIDITLTDQVILENNLLFKKEITDEEIEKYKQENYKYEVYNKVLKYIEKKVRSKKEIDIFLSKYELKNSDIKFIKDKLTTLNLYSDNQFIDSYIYDRFNLSNDGLNKIKKDLLNHQINEELIDEKLAKIDLNLVYDKLLKIVLKRIKLNKRYSKNEFTKKTTFDLINLGYDKDMIIELIEDNYSKEDDDVLKYEFDKLYTKLSKKYKGDNLYYQLKQKLYQKGFNIDDINNLIENKKTSIF